MSDKELIQDIDTLLDGTLDDLADMPEFKTFPVGAHKVTISFETKTIEGTGSGVEMKLTGIETVELPAGSEAAPLSAGDSTNIFFFLKHKNPKVVEMGQGQLKEILKVLREHFGAGHTNRELMEKADGLECIVATGHRFKDKGKPEQRVFTSLEALTVV